MYDLGKKKLLKKCENRSVPNFIMSIQTMGDRIYLTDVLESVHMAKYRRLENAMVVFADDTFPRSVGSYVCTQYTHVYIYVCACNGRP